MLQEKKDLIALCVKGMAKRGLSDDAYKERLKYELQNINIQGEHEYFVKLHKKFQEEGLKYPTNENNLLVDYLLDLTDEFNINEDVVWEQGEFPDIDIDYIKPVRDYLKREWAANEFGQDKICEIGTYGTSGIKSAILDMARVHNIPMEEIQSITVKMEDKDGDGNPIDWERIFIIAKEEREKNEKNAEEGKTGLTESVYLKFAKWCEAHPEAAKAAELLINRKRSGGVHAGGLIISNKNIGGFVPLEVRSVNKANPTGVICSAWTEGLSAQDLQPVGLIKFDLLVINNLMQIAIACDLVKKRHGLESICAKEGNGDWSDISYLDDPKSIAMANKADLKCIFQFDSDGIRKLVKRGGVTCFDDLAAYSAIYRPGPLNCVFRKSMIKLKHGEKPIEKVESGKDEIAYLNKNGTISHTKNFASWKTGNKKMVKIKTKSGKEIMVSLKHPILRQGDKFQEAGELKVGDKIAIIKED